MINATSLVELAMWLSSTAQQAVHAVLCIAEAEAKTPAGAVKTRVRVDEIARATGCPRNYLSKTLHQLTRAGVLKSERGPRGGFRLATSAERLTLARVIAPFEPRGKRRCLLGRAACGDANPCPVHYGWREIAESVEDFFSKTTIVSLLEENRPASAETRGFVHSLRNSHRRVPHGSAA